MLIPEMVKNQLMGLILLGALNGSAIAEATGTLKIFQITKGYNDGPALADGFDNGEWFGFDFHNGKIVACWMDDSATVTTSPPSLVESVVFGSAQINSPQDVIVGPNVVISNNQGFREHDPVVAIDRTNTQNISIIAANYRSIPHPSTEDSRGLLVVSSTDGGKNWTTNFSLQKNNFQPDSKMPIPLGIYQAQPRIGYDRYGNLIFSYVSSFPPVISQIFTAQFPYILYLCVSTDHGRSANVIQKFDPRNLDEVNYAYAVMAIGKDQLAIAPFSFGSPPPTSTPYGGQLFIIPIEGKGKFGPPTHITLPTGVMYGNGDGSLAFSPEGGLLIAQCNATGNSTQSCEIIFTSFIPKGAKEVPTATAFQPFKNVGVGGSAFYPPQPNFGTFTTPNVSYSYNGHHYGRAYMAYLDNPNVPASACSYGNSCSGYPTSSPPCMSSPGWADTNVYIAYSDDDGKTWSTPYAIPKTNTNTRILPQIAIDQTTGNIGVAWLDAVNDPANIKVQVFATVIPWDFFD